MIKNLLNFNQIWQTHMRKIPYLFLILISCGMANLHAQNTRRISEVPKPIVCPADFHDKHTHNGLPEKMNSQFRSSLRASATAEFLVTFGPGAEANPEAKAAFQFALDIWANEIVSSVPIRVSAEFATLGDGVLASAGPTDFLIDFPNAPDPNVFYPIALANSLAGEILFPEDNDFDLVVNLGDSISWYYGTDGNTPAGLFDFVTIALHEIGHGLGFTTLRTYNEATGNGSLLSGGFPSTHSVFMIDGDGNRLLDFEDNSVEIGNAFTGNDLFVDGTFSTAALAGNLPAIYAPTVFAGGSSLAHWDEATFPAGDPNSLMTPQAGSAESNFDVGPITRGHFKDMGWVINDSDAPPVVVTPGTFSEVLNVEETVSREITISSISDNPTNLTIETLNEASYIQFTGATTFALSTAETTSLEVVFNTIGLAKGFYEDTILVRAEGIENPIEIPVAIRVLDGTEAPLISVNPLSFNETIQQLSIVNKPLFIENNGDGDLSYSITVDDIQSTPEAFAARVKSSLEAISEFGFEKVAVSKTVRNSNEVDASLLIPTSGGLDKIETSLLATDFENFELGDINTQFGWTGSFEGNWTISNANAFDGTAHFRGISDGLGSTRSGSSLAFSPAVTLGDEPFTVFNAKINLQGTGVRWEVIPFSPTQGVATRLRFNADSTIDVLTEDGYIPVNSTIPNGYFNLRIVLDKADSSFTMYFDDELVFSGIGLASGMEQIVFLSTMEVVGSTFDVDNFEIIDGDSNTSFLSVTPSIGTVPFSSSGEATVNFDARSLEPGTYTGTINIANSDTTNPTIAVPVSLTVVEPPIIDIATELLTAEIDVINDDSATKTATFTITNTGATLLEYTLSTEQEYLTIVPLAGEIAFGDTTEITVTFDGTLLPNGVFEAPILINSNDPRTPVLSVATSLTVSGQTSVIAASDDLLLFDNVFIGATKDLELDITNTGRNPLTVSSITIDNTDFTVINDPFVVVPGATTAVAITFMPSMERNVNGTVTITSDAENETITTIVVNGVGVAPPVAVLSPDTVTTTLDELATANESVTLQNDGKAPLRYSFPKFAAARALANPNLRLNNTEHISFNDFTDKSKGFNDTRVGSVIESSVGTDITYGYTWIDSDEEGGPVYNFTDISTIGTSISALTQGDGTTEVNLPFDFEFYGNTFNSTFINANGFIAFQAPEAFATWVNTQIPERDQLDNIIAGLWADIEPQDFNGNLYVADLEDRFIIQWSDTPLFAGNAEETVTFQIVLYADGTIDIFYEDVESAAFINTASVGIENSDATDGAQVAFNTPYIKNGLALRFLVPAQPITPFITDVTPLSGVLLPGASTTLDVLVDSNGFEEGTYFDRLAVSSNAPDNSTSTSLFEMNVIGEPRILSFTLFNADTKEEIGILNDGDIIALDDYPTNSFNIVANKGANSIGSVVFDFNDVNGFSTENFAPYALAGDVNGSVRTLALSLGDNKITAQPFSGRRGSGEPGIPLTVSFKVIDNRLPAITGFTLINADTNTPIGSLSNNVEIDINLLGTSNLSIVAETTAVVPNSVIFDLNGITNYRTERIAPYTLAGDRNGNFNAIQFPLGLNTLKATAIGDVIGGELEISFNVIDSSQPVEEATILSSAYPNPTNGQFFFTIRDLKTNEVQVDLYNLLGFPVLKSTDFNINNQGESSVNMSSLIEGYYILRATNLKTGYIENNMVLKK